MKRFSMHALTAAMLAGVSLQVAAQPFDTPPPPAAPRPLSIAAPTERSLPNGLRVVVAERHGVPLVTARLVVLSGAEADPADRAGLAAMTAGLLTRGTQRHTAPRLVAAAEALGGSIDSSAGWHEASAGITVTTPQLSAALALLAEVVQQPTFAPAEIERYRQQVLDEMKLSYSQPGALSSMAAQRALFGGGAYGHPVQGTPASLPRVRRAELLRQHQAAYRPGNAVLVFAGDITPDDAMALARQHFAGWRAAEGGAAVPAPAALGALGALGAPWPAAPVVVEMPGAGQAGVAVAMPGVKAGSPDRFAGAVTNAVLGMGYSSRLNQEIRIKRGLSYGARSELDLRRDGGAVHVAVQTKNPSAAEVVGLVHAELDRLMAEPVPAPELAARKATLVGGFSRSLETTQGLAARLSTLVAEGIPVAELTRTIERLEAVDAAQVQRFAAGHFERAGRRVVVAGESSAFVAALKSQGEVLQVPQQALDLDAAAAPTAR